MPAVSTFVSLAITIASTAYQQQQARKAKDAAERAADAARGQFIATDNQIVALPIAYGRCRLSGAKVYHHTSSDFKPHPTGQQSYTDGVNVDVFSSSVVQSTTYEVEVDYGSTEPGAHIFEGKKYVTKEASPGSDMSSDQSGEKNEFLYVEQAICVGPINQCWDILIDEGLTYNREEYKHGMLIHVHRNGGSPDRMIVANDGSGVEGSTSPSRSAALFLNAAHAAMCFRLNRKDPQFNGVPNVNFLIEGRLVRRMTGPSAPSPSLVYSNNPVDCLLDYLTDDDFGAGLSDSQIDFKSFHDAWLACEVAAGVSITPQGKIWKTTKNSVNGGRNVTSNTFKRFECNMVIDTAKTVRENVNQLLSCMHNSRLVWSGGTYKLAFVYGYHASVGIIDDNVLTRETFDITPPSMDSRQNFCTVRFANEAKDFKEDTATYPPKFGAVHQQYLEDDNGLVLETDVSGAGITVKALAIARAEEVVKSSRHASKVDFSVVVKNVYYEPGDIVQIKSEALQLGLGTLEAEKFYVLIDSVKMEPNGTAKISGTRYLESVLAWNSPDNETGSVTNLEDTSLPVPEDFTFVQSQTTKSSGLLTWTDSTDKRVLGYKLYMARFDSATGNSITGYKLIGEDTESPFALDALDDGSYSFGIRSYGMAGRYSRMAIVGRNSQIIEDPLPPPVMVPVAEQKLLKAIKIAWTNKPTVVNSVSYPGLTVAEKARWAHTEIFYNMGASGNTTQLTPTSNPDGTVSNATLLTSSTAESYVHQTDIAGKYWYWARNVSQRNKPGPLCAIPSVYEVGATVNDYLDAVDEAVNANHVIIALREDIQLLNPVPLYERLAADVAAAELYANNKFNTAELYYKGFEETLITQINNLKDGVTDITVINENGAQTLDGIKTSTDFSSAAFLRLNTAYADNFVASMESVSGAMAQLNENSAHVVDMYKLVVTNTTSLVNKVEGLSATLSLVSDPLNPSEWGTNKLIKMDADILEAKTISLTADELAITRLNTIEGIVNVTGPDGLATTVKGRIADLDDIILNPDGGVLDRLSEAELGLKLPDGTTVNAGYQDLRSLTVTASNSINNRLNTLNTSFTNNKATTDGKIQEYDSLIVGENSSIVSKVTHLESTLLNTAKTAFRAEILNDYSTKAYADNSSATAFTSLRAYTTSGLSKTFTQSTPPQYRTGASGTEGTATYLPAAALQPGDIWIRTLSDATTSNVSANKAYLYDGLNTPAPLYGERIEGWLYNPEYGSAQALTAALANTASAINTLEQTKIGYCTLTSTGRTIDAVDSIDCANKGGTWHPGSPLATAVKQVTVNSGTGANAISASIEQAMTVSIDRAGEAVGQAAATQGKVNALYTLKVQTNVNGTKKITGFGTGIDANTGISSFAVTADQFMIANGVNDQQASPFAFYTTPYSYQDTSGVSRTLQGLYVKKAMIGDLIIGRGHIGKETGASITGSIGGSLSLGYSSGTFYVPIETGGASVVTIMIQENDTLIYQMMGGAGDNMQLYPVTVTYSVSINYTPMPARGGSMTYMIAGAPQGNYPVTVTASVTAGNYNVDNNYYQGAALVDGSGNALTPAQFYSKIGVGYTVLITYR